MRITEVQLRQLVRKAMITTGAQSTRNFVNEIGNEIQVHVEEGQDTGTNAETGARSQFDAIRIVVTGPTSTSENTLTRQEAEVLLECLHRVLAPQEPSQVNNFSENLSDL